MDRLFEGNSSTHLGLVALVLVAVVLLCLRVAPWTRKKTSPFPIIDVKINNMEPGLTQGSKLYPDQPYELRVPAKRIVILPRVMLDEIKSFPASQMSFKALVKDALVGEYTFIAIHDRSLATALRRDMTQNLTSVHEMFREEAISAAKKELGHCGKDYVAILLMPKLLNMVALLTSRVLVGPPLCYNEEWLKCMTKYTEDSFKAGFILHLAPNIFHHILNWCLPELWSVRKHCSTVRRLLGPILRERMENLKNPKFQPPRDIIQSFIDIDEVKGSSLDYQVINQLMAAFTSLHTTSLIACHSLFYLAAEPEYHAPLREEIESVIAEEGDLTSKAAMLKLRKLDSFIREGQRLNPTSFVGMERKILVDTTLSDGTFLPEGTIIGFNSLDVNYDPQLWENPHKFDGFRYDKLRTSKDSDHKYQATSISVEGLSFGLGTHACPGRFLAVSEVKILLAHLILNYDWAFPEGKGRPENITLISALLIDPKSEILCRKRQ